MDIDDCPNASMPLCARESVPTVLESKAAAKKYRQQLRLVNREEQKKKEEARQLTDVMALSRIPRACRPEQMGTHQQREEYRRVVLDLLHFASPDKKREDLVDSNLLQQAVNCCAWSWALVTRSPCFRSHSSTYRHAYHALVVIYKMRQGLVLYHEGEALVVVPHVEFFEKHLPTLRTLPSIQNQLEKRWACGTFTKCSKLLTKLIHSYQLDDLKKELWHRDLPHKKTNTDLYTVRQ